MQPDRTVKAPVMLLVEKEISGVVLNNRLRQPRGLAVTRTDKVFLTDAGNDRLVQFSGDLTPVRDFGGFGGQAGLLDRPTFITVDNDLNLMVSDENNRRVSRYNAGLNFVDDISFYDDEDPLKFGYPSGIAVTGYGEVWVADRDRNRIAVFSNVGRFDRFLGDYGYAGGQLSTPEKICRDRSGEFVVCDAGNSRLVIYDGYGNFVGELTYDGWEYPVAAAIGRDFIWVVDRAAGEISCLDPRDNLVLRSGPGLPGTDIALKQPSDIAVLSPEKLLIADTGNNRLLVCRIVYDEK
ncbi:MAG: NHL repeat-containing protein [Candidatus Zixiibacteriota bacterium]|nr:MAG: NHL repeat-containing protein [candidate division Zixibacteria bacterium]